MSDAAQRPAATPLLAVVLALALAGCDDVFSPDELLTLWGDIPTWIGAIALVIGLVSAARGVRRWTVGRLDPALSRLQASAAALEQRAPPVVLRRFTPSRVDPAILPPVLGDSWLTLGALSGVVGAGPELAAGIAVELAAVPGAAVALISSRAGAPAVSAAMRARGLSSTASPVFLVDDSGALGAGLANLLASLATHGAPLFVVADLTASWADREPATLARRLAEQVQGARLSAETAAVAALPEMAATDADRLAHAPGMGAVRRWDGERLVSTADGAGGSGGA